MSLDIAMGGSTNTVLHLLAAAQEAGVDFTMADIDRLSRKVPCLSKVAPAKPMCIWKMSTARAASCRSLGELDRAGLLHSDLPTVHSRTLGDALECMGYQPHQRSRSAEILQGCPGGVPTQTAFSQSRRWDELDLDRENGVIRSKEHAFSQGWRIGCAFRQYRARWLHREDRRRR
jgi:dihydroxy-acid dehydratase